MNSNSVDDIFHIASRIIFVVPVAAVIIALIMKFSGQPVTQSSETNAFPTPTVMKVAPVKQKTATPSAGLNLNGPLVCGISSNEATVSAYILNREISGSVTAGHSISDMLVKGDCLYSWNKGEYTGTKFCGISPYLNLLESMPVENFLNDSFISSILPGIFGQQNQSQTGEITTFLKAFTSCKKQNIPDTSVFKLPETVLFKAASGP